MPLHWLVLAPLAWGGEEILVPFQPPTEVPLPTRAGYVSGRFTSDATDCRAAAADALQQLQALAIARGLPHVVRLAEARESRDLSIRATCRAKHAGKEVVGTTVELLALATAGSDAEGWPTLSGDRAANLLWALSDLTGAPPVDLEIIGLGGTPGLVLAHEVDLEETALDVEGRAGWVIQNHVLPPITRWADVLAPYPEVGGVVTVSDVRSRNAVGEKEKRRERFRVVVRTSDAAAFLKGALTEQQLALRAGVYYRPTDEADVEVPLVIDLDAAEGQVAAPVETRERARDVSVDVDALTDEAP